MSTVPENGREATERQSYVCTRCKALIAKPRASVLKKGAFVCEQGHQVTEVVSFARSLAGGFLAGVGLFLAGFLLPFVVLLVFPWKIIQVAFLFVGLIGIGGIYMGPYFFLKGLFYSFCAKPVNRLAGGALGLGIGVFVAHAGAYSTFLYLYGFFAFAKVIGLTAAVG